MGLISLIIGILGAVWRRIDGGDNAPKMWHLTPLIIVLPTLYLDLNTGAALLLAWVALLDGFKGWEDWGYMSMRYTGYSALICTLTDTDPLYLIAGLISGLCYPLGAWLKTKYQKLEYTVYCEYLAGFLMFGGAVVFVS